MPEQRGESQHLLRNSMSQTAEAGPNAKYGLQGLGLFRFQPKGERCAFVLLRLQEH